MADVTESTFFKISDKVLTNMEVQQTGLSTTSVLLAGDPGVGKTSFVRTFCQLTGLNLVVIEVPHIVEEHIINVPFIVFDPATGKSEAKGTNVNVEETGVTRKTFSISLADSHLVSEIRSQKRMNDEEYLHHISSSNEVVKDLYSGFGGSSNKIPEEIKRVREKYKTILFLDEFFRRTSPRIRNVLRTILNGNIGLDRIPPGTYVIYASNLNDEGLDEVPKNVDFLTINMAAPTYDEWIKYMTSKHGVEDDQEYDEDGNVIDSDETDEKVPQKRGRGRPRKNK